MAIATTVIVLFRLSPATTLAVPASFVPHQVNPIQYNVSVEVFVDDQSVGSGEFEGSINGILKVGPTKILKSGDALTLDV